MRAKTALLIILALVFGLTWANGSAHAGKIPLAAVASDLAKQGDQAIADYTPDNGIETSDRFSNLYFDIFEGQGLESAIGLRDSARKGDLESRFSRIISLTARGAAQSKIAAAWKILRLGLEEEQAFYSSTKVDKNDWWPPLVKAFLILLREGVEALLVVGALIAYVKRAGTARQMKGLYSGILLALAASGLTAWAVHESVLGLGGRSLEAVEGVTMLVAAGVLLYVGHWLFSKREAERWQGYIKGKVDKAVASGGSLALSSAAFLAVYREGAETVLFYQALLADRPDAGQSVFIGFLAATLALSALFFVIRTLGLRMPLKPFFTATAMLLVLFGFIFVGKGVVELQVIRWISATPLEALPQVGWLGIFPTIESLVAQTAFLLLVVAGTMTPVARKART